MIIRSFITSIFCGLVFCASSQSYQYWIDSADFYYEIGNYQKSSITFDKAFLFENPRPTDYYNASCSNSLAGRSKEAIKFLELAFEKGEDDFGWMYYDKDLDPIRQHPGYNDLLELYKPDSIIYFFDLVELLQKDENYILIENKYLDFRFYRDGSEWDKGLGLYSNNELVSRLKVEGLEPSLDFSDKQLSFENCVFIAEDGYEDGGIPFLRLKTLNLTNCSTDELYLQNLELRNLSIYQTSFKNIVIDSILIEGHIQILNEKGSDLIIRNAEILIDTSDFEELSVPNANFFDNDRLITGIIHLESIRSLEMDNVRIQGKSDSILFSLDLDAKYVRIKNSQFSSPIGFIGAIENSLNISKNSFDSWVDIGCLRLPEFNCYIPFEQFNKDFVIGCSSNELLGISDNDLKDPEVFNKITDSYKRLYNNYRLRGELNSANASYLKLKELEIKYLRLKPVRTKEESTRLWLNNIMGVYTDFGTNPGKAIIISIYIIILFGIFYFFFPSDWDKSTKAKMVADFRLLIQKNEHGYIKPFLLLLRGCLQSFFNAIILSINSFVTLGFGAIPTKGIPRYICVIQGLLGWFLLSLFSVALINQVLL